MKAIKVSIESSAVSNLAIYENCFRVVLRDIYRFPSKKTYVQSDFTIVESKIYCPGETILNKQFKRANRMILCFSSRIEAENCIRAYNTRIMLGYQAKFSNDRHSLIKFTPDFGDFSKTWSEDDIKTYLQLTDQEAQMLINYIESFPIKAEVKDKISVREHTGNKPNTPMRTKVESEMSIFRNPELTKTELDTLYVAFKSKYPEKVNDLPSFIRYANRSLGQKMRHFRKEHTVITDCEHMVQDVPTAENAPINGMITSQQVLTHKVNKKTQRKACIVYKSWHKVNSVIPPYQHKTLTISSTYNRSKRISFIITETSRMITRAVVDAKMESSLARPPTLYDGIFDIEHFHINV